MKSIKILLGMMLILSGLAAAYFFMHGGKRVFAAVIVSYGVDVIHTPTDPITVRFSEPVDTASFAGHIAVTPLVPVLYAWSDDRMTLSLKPKDRWTPGGKYRVDIAGGKAAYGKNVPVISTSFSVPGYPRIVSLNPTDGATDILLGIEDPMIVRFDRSVGDFFIDFRLSPDLPVVYENDDAKSEFRIMPKDMLQPGTRYELSVYAKWRGEDDSRYAKLGSTGFTTLLEKPVAWTKDLTQRVAEVKRSVRPLITTGKYIDIDLSAQVMTIFEDGKFLDAYLVSSGKPGMETPKGSYQIRNKANRPLSKEYGLYMPNWMALVPDGKFGIHELPEWPNGYKEGANHLGIPVSHGCVRLGVGPAKRVFDWAELGTPVVVH